MQPLMPSVSTPDKLFHDGDPTQGIEGTIVEAEFMNNHQGATQNIQQELINVLAAAAMEPDPSKQDQLVTAIKAIVGGEIPEVPVKSVNQKTGDVVLGAGDVGALAKDGTAVAASKLATARNISGVSFDGSKDITISAANVGALPVSTAALGVNLNTLGAYAQAAIYYQTANANATAANNYPITEAGTLLVVPTAYGCQQEYTGFSSGRKFVRGLSAAWNGKDGPWFAWTEILTIKTSDARYYTKAQCDAGYQPKGNYTPAGQAYTKAESDARYGLKNTATKAANAMTSKDVTTGVMEVVMSNITVAANTNTNVTFSTAFPSVCVGVVIAYDGAGHGNDSDSSIAVASYTRTGCVIRANNANGKFMLIAKGY